MDALALRRVKIAKPAISPRRLAKTAKSQPNINSGRWRNLSDRNYVEYIEDKLTRECAMNPEYVFEAHKMIFDELIAKFTEHAPAMQLVKDGYDNLIEEFRQSAEDSLQKRNDEGKCLEGIQAEVENQRGKLNRKRLEIGNLIHNVRAVINDLTDELVDLRRRITLEERGLANEFEVLSRMKMTTMQHQEALDKLQARQDIKTKKLEALRAEFNLISGNHERFNQEMVENLDLTYDLNHQIKALRDRVEHFHALENDPLHLEQFRVKNMCAQVAQETNEIRKETEQFERETDEIIRAIDAIKSRPPDKRFIYAKEHAPLTVSESVHFVYIRE